MTVTERANAKINLYLSVTGKRADGFHDLQTVMHSVSLSDVLTIDIDPSDETTVKLSVIGECGLSSGEDNLIVRAARLYLSRSGITASVKVVLEKNIPIAAGLAGGSSDAAAVLRALNSVFSAFTDQQLRMLGAELGSDVPFCISGGTAYCTGRGENIEKLCSPAKLYFVIAIGKTGISTPSAFVALDRKYSDFDGSIVDIQHVPSSGLLRYLEPDCLARAEKVGGRTEIEEHKADALPVSDTPLSDDKVSKNGSKKQALPLYNIFESVTQVDHPEVDFIKTTLIKNGAIGALMSGSGPAVFGIFRTKSEAERAKETLSGNCITAFFAESAT